MPSFDTLTDDEVEALIEYVRYLSLRGETEIRLIEFVADEAELPPGGIAEIAGGFPLVRNKQGVPVEEPEYDHFVASIRWEWEVAPTLVIHPVTPDVQRDDSEALSASVERGRELFYAEETKCAGCHGESALGDGETTDYDAWFQWRKELDQAQAPQEKIDRKVAEMMALGALRPRNIRPRNLRKTTLRGGAQPVDIYRRIFSGINGTPMPAQGSLAGIAGDSVPEEEAGGGISRQQMWDLVHYTLSLQQQPSEPPPPPIDGDDLASFEMTERSGSKFDFRALRGEVWIASLFFSTCPHQCRRLNETIAALQRDEIMREVKYVSVSVDPVVDTPEVLSDYAALFDADPERWLFFRAEQPEIDRFGKFLGISAGYKMHARSLVLFDHTGKVRGRYAFNEPDEIISLRKLVPVLLAEKEKTGRPP
jgi:cytochrome oxidase Cu insertion factor (SCO1/SenC/PrrC family)